MGLADFDLTKLTIAEIDAELTSVDAAISTILGGGVLSYTIGGRTLTRNVQSLGTLYEWKAALLNAKKEKCDETDYGDGGISILVEFGEEQ